MENTTEVEIVKRYIDEGVRARSLLDPHDVAEVARVVAHCFKNGKKLLLFGNGGSAADAQHIAAEFVGRFLKERRSLPALALTTNTSVLTAISNDYSYELVFARQVEAFGERGDVAFAISTSGNSRNVLEGVKAAKNLGIYTVGLTGGSGGKLKELVNKAVVVASDKTSIIQEVHIAVGHMVSLLVERELFGGF